MYVDGDASGAVKQQLWDTYGKLDPDYTSGDLVLNINSVANVVEGAKVVCEVISHVRGEKVIVFHKKRRKGYQKMNGHRQKYTQIQINAIQL